MHRPSYDFLTFKAACGNNQLVIAHRDALNDALNDFNLNSEKALLDFIHNDGLDRRKFINSKPWENNPDPDTPIMVDGYEFSSLSKLGYLAFFFNKITGKWIIKSFHLSENRNPVMEDAFRKAIECIQYDEKGEVKDHA